MILVSIKKILIKVDIVCIIVLVGVNEFGKRKKDLIKH